MTDENYQLVAEAGVVQTTGTSLKIRRMTEVPEQHPVHSLIGRIAAIWAEVEHRLDRIIWEVAKLEYFVGPCLTGQIMGSFGKITTIHALCLARKPVNEDALKQIKTLTQKLRGAQDRRNRILHDPWFIITEVTTEGHPQVTSQYKSMARGENLVGFHPVDEAYLLETIATFNRRLADIAELRQTLQAS